MYFTATLYLCFFVVYLSGFTPGARELFKQENHLALYQLPTGEKTKEFTSRHLHCFTKRQPPMSHLISLFVRDSSSSESGQALVCLSLPTCLFSIFQPLMEIDK